MDMENDHFDAPAEVTATRRPTDIELGDTVVMGDGTYLTVEDIEYDEEGRRFIFTGSDDAGDDDEFIVSEDITVERVLANGEEPVEGYLEPGASATFASDDPEDRPALSAVDRLITKLSRGGN